MSILKLLGGLFKGKKTAKRPVAKGTKKPRKRAIQKTRKIWARKAPKKVQKKIQKKASKTKKQKAAEKPIGIVTHWFGKISVGIIKLKSDLKIGDRIRIKGAHDDVVQTVASMQLHHKDVPRAKKGAEIGIKVARRVHENSRVYRG